MPRRSKMGPSQAAQTRHGKQAPPLGRMIRLYRHVENQSLRDLATEIGGLSAATLMRLEQGYAVDTATFFSVLAWLLDFKEGGRP